MTMRNHRSTNVRRSAVFAIAAVLFSGLLFAGVGGSKAQIALTSKDSAAALRFRVGEKLTYNLSFGKFLDAGYLETSVVSRGLLSGIDAVELKSKVKTLGFVSAAFFQFDQTRTVYASPDTGLPLYVSKVVNSGPFPRETVGNYLSSPTSQFDLLTLLYKARQVTDTATLSLFENDQNYTVALQNTGSEHIKVEAGEFDTSIYSVQSDYLTVNGIKDLKVNFSSDKNHLPVLLRLKTSKGEFRASLLTVQLPQPPVIALPPITPVVIPVAPVGPRPKPTPTPYIDNQPLSVELGFDIGETLNYNVTDGGKPAAVITLSAKERKLFQNEDSLLLSARVTGIEQGNRQFALGDIVQVQVDPETLTPRWLGIKFAGGLKDLNQDVTFDRLTGAITVRGGKPVDSPIGTHTILSLLYAMRSFNLRPSKDPNNPVNDTRVAVFWDSQTSIFTLRPGNPEDITINGEKVSAQPVIVKTGNDKLDKLALKVWLSVSGRFPIRLTWGTYQADLIMPSGKTP